MSHGSYGLSRFVSYSCFAFLLRAVDCFRWQLTIQFPAGKIGFPQHQRSQSLNTNTWIFQATLFKMSALVFVRLIVDRIWALFKVSKKLNLTQKCTSRWVYAPWISSIMFELNYIMLVFSNKWKKVELNDFKLMIQKSLAPSDENQPAVPGSINSIPYVGDVISSTLRKESI